MTDDITISEVQMQSRAGPHWNVNLTGQETRNQGWKQWTQTVKQLRLLLRKTTKIRGYKAFTELGLLNLFQCSRRRWRANRCSPVDGIINLGVIHHYHGWPVLLDRRLGFRYLAVFSVCHLSHNWFWWRGANERAGNRSRCCFTNKRTFLTSRQPFEKIRFHNSKGFYFDLFYFVSFLQNAFVFCFLVCLLECVPRLPWPFRTVHYTQHDRF